MRKVLAALLIAGIPFVAGANPQHEVLWLQQLDSSTQCRWLLDHVGPNGEPPREARILYGSKADEGMEMCEIIAKLDAAEKARKAD